MNSHLKRVMAAQHLRELLSSNLVGDLAHETRDPDVLDMLLKVVQRCSEVARAEADGK